MQVPHVKQPGQTSLPSIASENNHVQGTLFQRPVVDAIDAGCIRAGSNARLYPSTTSNGALHRLSALLPHDPWILTEPVRTVLAVLLSSAIIACSDALPTSNFLRTRRDRLAPARAHASAPSTPNAAPQLQSESPRRIERNPPVASAADPLPGKDESEFHGIALFE